MNKRTQELALQANGPNPFYGTLKNQMTLLGDTAVEKFAKLIVQDCRDMFIVDSPSWNLLNEKLDHFGVEE